MTLENGSETSCPYCGEPLWIPIDPDAGRRQSFVHDCEVCCRPIHCATVREPDGSYRLAARAEDDT